jgi:hypothetical protein
MASLQIMYLLIAAAWVSSISASGLECSTDTDNPPEELALVQRHASVVSMKQQQESNQHELDDDEVASHKPPTDKESHWDTIQPTEEKMIHQRRCQRFRSRGKKWTDNDHVNGEQILLDGQEIMVNDNSFKTPNGEANKEVCLEACRTQFDRLITGVGPTDVGCCQFIDKLDRDKYPNEKKNHRDVLACIDKAPYNSPDPVTGKVGGHHWDCDEETGCWLIIGTDGYMVNTTNHYSHASVIINEDSTFAVKATLEINFDSDPYMAISLKAISKAIRKSVTERCRDILKLNKFPKSRVVVKLSADSPAGLMQGIDATITIMPPEGTPAAAIGEPMLKHPKDLTLKIISKMQNAGFSEVGVVLSNVDFSVVTTTTTTTAFPTPSPTASPTPFPTPSPTAYPTPFPTPSPTTATTKTNPDASVQNCFDWCQPRCNPDTKASEADKHQGEDGIWRSCVEYPISGKQCQVKFGKVGWQGQAHDTKMDWTGTSCHCKCKFYSYPGGLWSKVQFEDSKCDKSFPTGHVLEGCYKEVSEKAHHVSCEPSPNPPNTPKFRLTLNRDVAKTWPQGDYCMDQKADGCWFLDQTTGTFQLSGPRKSWHGPIKLKLYVSCNLDVPDPGCDTVVNGKKQTNTFMSLKPTKIAGGTLRIMWGGEEVSQDNGYVVSHHIFPEVNKPFYARLPAEVDYQVSIEFTPKEKPTYPNQNNQRYAVELEDLSFNVPPDMLDCVAQQGNSQHQDVIQSALKFLLPIRQQLVSLRESQQ